LASISFKWLSVSDRCPNISCATELIDAEDPGVGRA
jgi:hypothetical protein